MGITSWPQGSSGGTTNLTPFTGPVITVPSAINQIEPSGLTVIWDGVTGGPVPPADSTSTFVTNNAAYGGNSYATATLHLRAGGFGGAGIVCVAEGSDDAQATWTPMAGINAATGKTEMTLSPPDNGQAMWYLPVAGLSIVRARLIFKGSGGALASWTGSAAGIVSPTDSGTTDTSIRAINQNIDALQAVATVSTKNCARVSFWIRTLGVPAWTGTNTVEFEASDTGALWYRLAVSPMEGGGTLTWTQLLPTGRTLATYMSNQVGGAIFARARTAAVGTGGIRVNAVATP